MKRKVVLECERCGSRNYTLDSKREQADSRLELNKFCKSCNQHTTHKQSI